MQAVGSCWHCGARLRPEFSSCRACGSSIRRSAREARLDNSLATSRTDFEYAGKFIRVVAAIIDGIILGAVGYALQWFIQIAPPTLTEAELEGRLEGAESGAAALDILFGSLTQSMAPAMALGLIVGMVYNLVCLCSSGRTFGNLVTGTKVVDESGDLLGPLAVVMRVLVGDLSRTVFCFGYFFDLPYLLYAFPFVGMIDTYGNGMALWDGRNQTLHDKVAGSVVIRSSRY